MVAQTQAQVTFTGSGNLGQLIEKINENVKTFGINTGKATKGLGNLNKEAKVTDGLFKGLAKNVKGTADGFLNLGKNTKDTLNFFTQAGKNTLQFSDAVNEANKGVSGLGLRFLGLKKETNLLNQVLDGPAAHLADIANAGNNTERAFIILSKIAKPLRTALQFLSVQAEKLADFFLDLEKAVVRLVKSGIQVAVKAIEFFARTFQNLSQTVAKFGLIGKGVSAQFSNIGKSLQDSSMRAKEFNDSLDPAQLERVDKAGQKVSGAFAKLAGGLQTAAAGVILADTLGKAVRGFLGVRDAAQATGDTITSAFTTGSEVFQKSGAQAQLFNNKLTVVGATTQTLGKLFQNQLLKSIGAAAAQANVFIAAFQGIKIVTEGIADAAIQASGLNDAFAQAQALGIDTTAAEIAFQFGLVGERLLFSAEAAKEFGRAAVTAFAQTEDAAAFVTTLSSGANLQFGELEQGLQSVTAFSTELANALDNTVTSGEAAFALYNTLSAGIGIASDGTQDLAAQQNFLEASLKLSSGTGADAAQTLDLLAKTTTVYGLSANDAATTAAKLNQVVEQGQITFPQLTNNLGRTLATAEATNVTLDETLASVSALTKVQGEDALVGFQSLLSAIAGQGEQAKKEIQELGVQFDLQTVKSKGLNVALRDLVAATGGNAETLKRIIPDTLAFQTALTLVNSVASDVDSTLQNVATAGEDSLEAVFAAGNQSTVKQFTNIMNGFNEVLVDFGQRVQPALQPGLDALNGLLNIFQNLPEPIKNVIGSIVIAQTVISNIGGGFLGLITTIGKLILSVIAFRLVNKALTGQLKSELDVIKQLVAVEGDYAGAFTRMIGLNENFSSATIQTAKAVNNTRKALEQLEKQGFEFTGTEIEDFERAIEEVQMRIREVSRSPLRLTDPENTQTQIRQLKALQTQLKEAVTTTRVARKLSLKETRKDIDNALKEVNATASQRIGEFQNQILGLVNPNLVGAQSERFQREISGLFETSLSNAAMTAEQKVGRISKVFSGLRADASGSTREFLNQVEAELLSGFGRIEGQADNFRTTFAQISQGLFGNASEAVKVAFDKAAMEAQEGLFDLEATLEQRKVPLKQVFRETFEALPEELDSLKPQLIRETDKLLDASRGTVESRIQDFNVTFARLTRGLPDEIRVQAGEVKLATQELTRAIEAPLAGRDVFGIAFAKAALNLRNGVQTIQEITPVAESKLNMLNETIKQKLGETATSVVEATQKIEIKAKQELLGAAAALAIEYESLVPSNIKDTIDDRLSDVREVLSTNIEKLNRGEVNLDQFKMSFQKAIAEVRAGLEDMVSPEVRREIESDLGKFVRQVDVKVNEINEEFEEIAGSTVRQQINQNLNKLAQDVEQFSKKTKAKIDQVGKGGSRAFGAFTDSLDGLSGILGTVSPQLAAVLDGTSSFLFNSRELTEGLSGLSQATKGYSGNLKQVAAQSASTTKAQGLMAATNKLLGRNVLASGKSMTVFNTAAIKATASAGLFAKTATVLSGGLAAVSTGFGIATTAAGSFLAAAAPIAVPVAAITGGLFLLVQAIRELIPGSNALSSGSQKFAFAAEEANMEVERSLELFQKYKDSSDGFGRDVDGNVQSLAQMKAAVEETNEALEDERAPKAFVQGFRGAVISVVEFFVMLPTQIGAALVNIVLRTNQAIAEFASNIPIIGRAFKPIADSVGRFADFTENQFKKTNNRVRDFFNVVREDNQRFIAGAAREAVQESQLLTQQLILETTKVSAAQGKGEVAAERSKALIAQAEEANRALTGAEFAEVIKEENALSQLSIELLNEQIAAREEELEKAKDPVVRESLEFQLDNLRQQTTELERRNKLQEEFLRNQQAIGVNIQANNAAQSQEAVNAQLQQTITELGNVENGGEKAQQVFRDILGVSEQVNAETGEIEFIREDSVNQASQAGRRAQLAVDSTLAKISSSIANFNDADINISQDDIAQSIFQTFDAVEKAISEDPAFAETGGRILDNLLTQGIETATGVEGQLADVFSPAQLAELLERQTALVETEFQQRTRAQERSIERINVLQETGAVTAVDAARATAEAQESIDQERIHSIERRLQVVRDLNLEGSQAEKALISELNQFRLQADLNRLNERRKILDEELNLLRAQKENEVQLLKNENQERLNTIQLIEKANQQEQKALGARQNLAQATAQFEETILQNRLKLTGDVEEQAEIQLQLAQQRLVVQEQENEFERQNIMLQQQLNDLALEREQIQLRIQAAEAQAELAANNARLAKADELGLTQEEQEAIQLQNDALNIQTGLLEDSQAQLEEFAMQQETINSQQLEALDLRQRAQREAANVDIEIAQRNRVLATFDKQIQQAQLAQRITEVTAQERQVNLNRETSLLESQTKILEEQKGILESTSNIVQQNFQIAISAERNEFRKRRLEEEAARARLKALETQQQIEAAIFKINEQQRDLALEVRQIELSAAREKAQAELAVAEAEAAKVAANPTSTQEEIQAAQLGIRAAEAQLSATEAQQALVAQERAVNAQGAGLRELQFQQQQQQQLREAEFAVAQTTRRRSDDRQIARAAVTDARAQQQQFEQLGQSFLRGLNTQATTDPSTVASFVAPNISAPTPQALGPATPMPNQQITSDLNVNVNVTGSTEGLDTAAIQTSVKNATVQSWNEFIDELRRRNT